MYIVERYIEKDNSGSMLLWCVDQDDLWHLYNTIRIGDCVAAWTDRKINACDSRSKPIRETCELEVRVTSVDFDPVYEGIRVHGVLTPDSPYTGSHHTLDIKVNMRFTLYKKCWASFDVKRIETTVGTFNEQMTSVTLHEGFAQICVITETMTVVKAKVEMQVARKRAGFAINHEKSLQRFLETVAKAFLRHIDMDSMKAVIVAAREKLNEQFVKVLFDVADQMNAPIKKKNRNKFVFGNIASGYKHSLKQILSDPSTAHLLAGSKAHEEVKTLEKFMNLFDNDPSRAFYGYKHVDMANQLSAIDTLMVSDALFRSHDIQKREKYIKLVESVQENNGKVLIFSSLHVTGEQLDQMTGVAAILRYPLPELEDEDMEEDEKEEANAVTIKVHEYVVREFPNEVFVDSDDVDAIATSTF
uniref:Protein pelota homolog n=1 Tax=Panagrellus redivivus TaxID=6233 RepID=A0A7E4W011_PANRE